MLPRSKRIWIVTGLICACLFYSNCPASAGNVFIQFYQDHISAVDGQRCPMHPSCSAYAAGAFEKHGPLLGWIMTCDRLVRCGRDEADISSEIISGGHHLVYDPVAANDFWWFEKEERE